MIAARRTGEDFGYVLEQLDPAVECAAGIALMKALFPQEPTPEAEYDVRWSLKLWRE